MKLWIRLVICVGPAVLAGTVAFAQMAPPGTAPGASQSQGPFELVDPKVFRVCADPHNLPYSDTNGAGFENRIAELFAKELGKGISFTWFPNAPGFVVFRPGRGLDGVDTLTDPRLKDKLIGVVAGTPPATNLVLDGLIEKAKSYPLVVDKRYDSSAIAMVNDIVRFCLDRYVPRDARGRAAERRARQPYHGI